MMHIACAQHAHSSATQPVPHASVRAYHSRTCRPAYVLTYLRTHTRTYLVIRTRSQYLYSLTYLLTEAFTYTTRRTIRSGTCQLPVLLTHSPTYLPRHLLSLQGGRYEATRARAAARRGRAARPAAVVVKCTYRCSAHASAVVSVLVQK